LENPSLSLAHRKLCAAAAHASIEEHRLDEKVVYAGPAARDGPLRSFLRKLGTVAVVRRLRQSSARPNSCVMSITSGSLIEGEVRASVMEETA
jgi:hypothetical protein